MKAKIDDAHKAARSLESYLLRRVLAEVKTSENSMTGGGFAGDTFKDMFDEAIADAMASAGGIGLADIIAKQLDPHKKAKGAEDASASPAAASKPIALPTADFLAHPAAHPVAQLVTDPLGNRTVGEMQAPATPALSIGATGGVSLRRYRAAEAPDPAPSSLPASGRPTERR